MADISPALLLDGETPRLIDEWQIAPKLWDAVRFEVDHRDEFGQFILTGSSVPIADDATSHTGTGRISRMLMRPMSLYESEDSEGTVSLKALFDNQDMVAVKNPLDINMLAFLVCRGGWPKAVGQREKVALQQAFDYYDAVVNSDISRADGILRNPERVKLLMKSFAWNPNPRSKVAIRTSDTRFFVDPSIATAALG